MIESETVEKTAGIITSNEDLTELIELIVQINGFKTTCQDFSEIKSSPTLYISFLKRYNPDILVIEIPPPYKTNCEFVSGLTALPESQGRGFVYITTDITQLAGLVQKTETQELIKQPFDLDELEQAISRCHQCIQNKNLL